MNIIGKIPFSSLEMPLLMSFLIITTVIFLSYFILTLLSNVKKFKKFPLEVSAYYLLLIWIGCFILFCFVSISILLMSKYHIGFIRAFVGTILTSAFMMALLIVYPSVLFRLTKKHPKKKVLFKFLLNSIILALAFVALFILIMRLF